MLAVESIFSLEQIQGLWFFFPYFCCVLHFHTLGWSLVFTPNYIFRHKDETKLTFFATIKFKK